jgi:hypothetical protein
MEKIIVNKIQCKNCKDIIESKTRHNMVWCKCGKVAVDGGHDYLRRVGELENIIELSVISDELEDSDDQDKKIANKNEDKK